MVWTRDRIHDATGFDNGDLFRSAEEVREYFTVANIEAMFGECLYTQDELDEMAEAVIANRWHMAIPVDEYRTVYSDGFGAEFEAIQLPWCAVTDILGRDHEGNEEDDARLIQALREMGAPEWIDEAEGWADEHGWGLIGPRLSVDVTNPWSGASVTITRADVTSERLEALAALMPDDIREELHREFPDEPFAFWAAYVNRVGPEEAGKLWFS